MNELDFIDMILLGIILFLIFGFIALSCWSITQPKDMSPKDWMDIDFMACDQMRDSGWTEEEIKRFMDDNNGYYDKDYL